MKIQKLALAGLLALASVVPSFGTTTIRIIGSTAYRAAVNDAIGKILNTGYTWAIAAGSTSNTALAGASAGWWSGTLKSTSASVVIKTYFTGSISGAVDISIPHTVNGFIPDTMNDGSATGSVSGVAVSSGALTSSTEYTAETNEPADFAWTDTNQTTDALICQHATSSTAYNDTVGAGLTEAGTLAPGVNGQGIVYFNLVLEKLSSGSNPIPQGLSSDNLCTMITQGYISVAQVTGTTTGNGTTSDIFLIGRNEDSGSRGNVFIDAFEGYNIGSKNNIQFLPNYTGTPASYTDSGAPTPSYTNAAGTVITGGTVYDGGATGTLAGLIEWPKNWALNTDSTIKWNTTGHSGFISGGEVASALSAPDPVTGITVNIAGSTYTPSATYVVGYLGGTDTATATTNGATVLPYNGVSYSYNNVINGTYGLWGVEHAFYLSSDTGDLVQACNDLSDEVYQYTAEDSPSLVAGDTAVDAVGIYMSVMTQVTRGAPGAPILESYNP